MGVVLQIMFGEGKTVYLATLELQVIYRVKLVLTALH